MAPKEDSSCILRRLLAVRDRRGSANMFFGNPHGLRDFGLTVPSCVRGVLRGCACAWRVGLTVTHTGKRFVKMNIPRAGVEMQPRPTRYCTRRYWKTHILLYSPGVWPDVLEANRREIETNERLCQRCRLGRPAFVPPRARAGPRARQAVTRARALRPSGAHRSRKAGHVRLAQGEGVGSGCRPG